MCDFTYPIEPKKQNGSVNDSWYNPDTCPNCKMHWSMCECSKPNNQNNQEVDICGPNYPPC